MSARADIAVVECISIEDGTRYALKLSPDRTISEQEATALANWEDVHTVVDRVDADTSGGGILLDWLPDATELPANSAIVAEISDLIADLYSSRHMPPPTVPLARERVEVGFELWDRRRPAVAF